MRTVNPDMTVGRVVVEHPVTARVFERLGIDYCCGGGRTLREACEKKGLELGNVLDQLAREPVGSGDGEQRDWSAASAAELMEHIESTHHAYLKRELPRLGRLVAKVAAVHGEAEPALQEVRDVFSRLAQELAEHMAKEERVLFPWIKLLEAGAGAPAGVTRPIAVMIHEHDDAGAALARLRELTRDYTPPPTACGSYRAMLAGLSELEADLHEHVHKENNILFPKATALEAAAAGAGPSCGCSCACTSKEE